MSKRYLIISLDDDDSEPSNDSAKLQPIILQLWPPTVIAVVAAVAMWLLGWIITVVFNLACNCSTSSPLSLIQTGFFVFVAWAINAHAMIKIHKGEIANGKRIGDLISYRNMGAEDLYEHGWLLGPAVLLLVLFVNIIRLFSSL